MSIQFPNSPSTGSTFDASNGLTYRWDGEKWITQGSYNANTDPEAAYVNVSGDTMTGDLTVGSSSINANGSARFAGNITATADSISSSTVGSDGSIVLRKQSGDAFKIQDVSANDKTVFQADGSASFAGSVQQGLETLSDPGNLMFGTGGYYTRFTDGTGTAFQVKNNTADTVLIKSDGTASFAGNVTSSDGTNSSSIRPGFMLISSPADFGQVLGCYTGSAYSWSIDADGSAEFAGVVAVNRSVSGNGCFHAQLNGTTNIALNSNGTATFASNITLQGSSAYLVVNRTGASGSTTLAQFGTDSNGQAIEFKADGSASFAGNITAGNVTFSLPSGAVLDVKDRLTKVDGALQALKTAAAASTDFAALKAAIATALTDI